MRAAAEDLYQLRKAKLDAERLQLLAGLAENRAKSLLLDIERRYGLLATEATLDIHSGQITKADEEGEGEPNGDEGAGTQGPA
jgi:hypothetical protein